MPLGAVVYLALVAAQAARATPEVVYWLAPCPLAALGLGWRARAGAIVVGAILELALLVPIHGVLTFVHAWRLEGG
jgi:hypothetical protein